jgi:dihydrofolate reductase
MKLVYSAIASLDGFVEDQTGAFEWGAPDEEVHAFVNDLERPIGTYLYGRRMYETMVYWETTNRQSDPSPTSGRQRKRSSSPRRWSRSPARGRASKRTSTPQPYDASRRPPSTT